MYCCIKCFRNEYIIGSIEEYGEIGDCDYCKSKGEFIIHVKKFGEFLRKCLSKGYVNATTDDIPYHVISKFVETFTIIDLLRSEEYIFSDLTDYDNSCVRLISDAFDFSSPSYRDIAQGAIDEWENGDAEVILIDGFYRGDDSLFTVTWESFKQRVKHDNRFFDINTSETREEMLDVFSDFFNEMNIDLPKGTQIIRARKNSEGPFEASEKQTLECGPPPVSYAISLRMSPDGISYFYGSDNKRTCLNEIRSSNEDRIVVGTFQTKSNLKLIDLSNIPRVTPPSIFSPSYVHEMNWAYDFLKSFSDEISVPVMEDNASIEYIPTQILSEYIRLKGFDGVKYRSSLTGGENYTLFCGRYEKEYNPYQFESSIPDFRDWLKLVDYEHTSN